jgi:hypothetical protein
MTDAQNILKMIGTVDPSDAAKLDEIDARVWCWLRGYIFEHVDSGFVKAVGRPPYLGIKKYTRSRDALKSIRPEGYGVPNFCKYFDGFVSAISKGDIKENNLRIISAPKCRTEELAELHAIIQAIDYERGKNEKENQDIHKQDR